MIGVGVEIEGEKNQEEDERLRQVMARLDAISIEDLCTRARAAGVDCGGGTADFAI